MYVQSPKFSWLLSEFIIDVLFTSKFHILLISLCITSATKPKSSLTLRSEISLLLLTKLRE